MRNGAQYEVALAGGEITGRVDAEELREQLEAIRDALSPVIEEDDKLMLSSLAIGLTVSAEGKVVFVSAGVTASITLTFSRSSGR